MASEPHVETSPEVSDEIRQTTCYMCACRCGINVHVRDDKIRYIEGNRDHPINKGVLCAKGSAGIMQHYSPARLKQPMKRVGPRGSGEFEYDIVPGDPDHSILVYRFNSTDPGIMMPELGRHPIHKKGIN